MRGFSLCVACVFPFVFRTVNSRHKSHNGKKCTVNTRHKSHNGKNGPCRPVAFPFALPLFYPLWSVP